MTADEDPLSLDQALFRLRAALARDWPNLSIGVSEQNILTRDYGWVFSLNVAATDLPDAAPRLVLINKLTSQAVWTTTPYTVEEFAAEFETLLKQRQVNAHDWCLTGRSPFSRPTNPIDQSRAAGMKELTL